MSGNNTIQCFRNEICRRHAHRPFLLKTTGRLGDPYAPGRKPPGMMPWRLHIVAAQNAHRLELSCHVRGHHLGGIKYPCDAHSAPINAKRTLFIVDMVLRRVKTFPEQKYEMPQLYGTKERCIKWLPMPQPHGTKDRTLGRLRPMD